MQYEDVIVGNWVTTVQTRRSASRRQFNSHLRRNLTRQSSRVGVASINRVSGVALDEKLSTIFIQLVCASCTAKHILCLIRDFALGLACVSRSLLLSILCCFHSDDCEVDSDCGTQGQCLLVTHFSYPQKQCFCRPGYFGLHCEKGSYKSPLMYCTH